MIETEKGRADVTRFTIDVAVRLALIASVVYLSIGLMRPVAPLIIWAIILAVAVYPLFAALRRRMRLHHGPRVKGRDLVVVAVRHDHGLRGVGVLHLAHVAAIDVQRLQPLKVVGPIAAQHGHGQRLTPQELEAVGNIARTPTKIAAQRRHQE